MSATEERRSGAFASRADRRRWWLLFLSITALAAACVIGLVLYGNPAVVGSRGFWRIVDRRMDAVIAMAVVALCQAMATVSFQTVTGNRILTPSILGFESLYRAIHTTTIFLFGVAGLNAARTTSMFLLQLALMIGLSLLLYSWLLLGSVKGLYPMLLVGIIIGAGLGSLSTFMQRLLTPSEFDVLTARLFGSVNNADPDYYPVAIPLILGAAIVLYALSKRLNVLSLGRDTTTSLGVGHARISLTVLVLISVLMATSTALVGPMTFLGFLVATLAYQLSPTYDHRYVFPMAVSLAMLTLCGAYFLMRNVFSAQGVVSIIIEFVGGALFLIVLLRRGRL